MTAMFAAWHPKKKFGPTENITLRTTFKEAEEDADRSNYCDQKFGWRAVRVDLEIDRSFDPETEPYESRLAEMFE